ncbi:MAG: YicC/YloC family endoribonuclease [Bacillus sp. (in: firmicutes)]
MVMSMTGYGRGSSEGEQFRILAEIKTVNHRFCEYQIRMPRQLLALEDKIRKQLSSYIKRGRAEVFITVEGDGLVHKHLHIDWELLDQYMGNIELMAKRYHLHPPSSPHELLELENVFLIRDEQVDFTEVEGFILEAVQAAATELKEMREREGARLKADLNHQLAKLQQSVTDVKERAPLVIVQYKDKLKARMTEWAAGQLDEPRLLTEAALFADKADINEELIRLDSHIHQMMLSFESEEAIGRKLDFLVQEMNREVNTIGSKANDSQIAARVVEMKSLLEKMKEQIQNIE